MEWNGARESAWFRFSSNEIATAGAPGISSLREEAVPFRAQFKGSGLRVYAIGHADCHEAKHLATKWMPIKN